MTTLKKGWKYLQFPKDGYAPTIGSQKSHQQFLLLHFSVSLRQYHLFVHNIRPIIGKIALGYNMGIWLEID